jgi:hypothetical protein
MAKTRVFFDNKEQRSPTWDHLGALLTELERGRGHALFLEDSGGFEMNVVYVKGFGYYVSTLSATDPERIASDISLPNEKVNVLIADEQEVPRSVLIGSELANIIVREFYETGKRSPATDWVDPSEVIK